MKKGSQLVKIPTIVYDGKIVLNSHDRGYEIVRDGNGPHCRDLKGPSYENLPMIWLNYFLSIFLKKIKLIFKNLGPHFNIFIQK